MREDLLDELVTILMDHIRRLDQEIKGKRYEKQRDRSRRTLSQLVRTLAMLLELQPEEVGDKELLAIINRIPDPARKRAKAVLEKSLKGRAQGGKDTRKVVKVG